MPGSSDRTVRALPAPPSDGLPDGFAVRLGRRVRVDDGGLTLIGGAPTRVLYLKPRAAALLSDRTLTVSNVGTRALAERLLDAGMADPVLSSLPPVDVAAVTFVIPVYGRPGALDRLLSSLPDGSRTIVVDDLSPDRDAIVRVARRHGAVLVLLEVNGGPARARNEGLRQVTTPFAAFADTDIVIDDDTVAALLTHFADPRVALVAPRVHGLQDSSELNWIGKYEQARSSLDLGPDPALVRQRSPVSWVPAAFLIARVAAVGAGFSAEMREGEDVDLVWRLADGGWRIRYEPEAAVWHEHRQTLIAWLSRKAFYGSSAHPLAVRHHHDVAPAVLAPWNIGVIGALLAQRRWSLPVAGSIAAVTAWRVSRKLSRSKHPFQQAARLTASGVGSSLVQTTALLVRHWWPVALLLSIVSPRIRRALIVSAVVDAGIEWVRLRPDLDPVRFGVARRLDDLAYGAGVWWSALKGRSLRGVLPYVRRHDS
ncbi:MAG: mycofactocin system glycosyltransferase [Frondihabitans sp.]|nr:mycofactocin system glycosyltransferase [Frondihabitans sp.]